MWKDLSLKEKRELIKLYVSNGITNRRDIIADYDSSVSSANEFKKGGFKEKLLNKVRRKLYDNVSPYTYESVYDRTKRSLEDGANEEIQPIKPNDDGSVDKPRDDIFAEYLSIPQEERHKNTGAVKVIESNYAPSLGREGLSYKALDLSEIDKEALIIDALSHGDKSHVSGALHHYLGPHTVGLGQDERGQYVSYYDKWDLNPLYGENAEKTSGNRILDWWSRRRNGEDVSLGIGKPVNFYDRIYLDDFYGVNRPQLGEDEYYGGYIKPAVLIG